MLRIWKMEVIPMENAFAARRLVRIPAHGRIAGVCAGIASFLDVDVTLVRVAWIVLSICPGALVGGILAYLAAWLIMPEASGDVAVPVRITLTRSRTDRKVGGVCGGLAAYVGIDSTVVRLAWVVLTIVPGAIVLGAVAYLVAWFLIPEGSSETMAPAASRA
jgi:phage shock protein PspC (stress-responsive transcriptional regulator)